MSTTREKEFIATQIKAYETSCLQKCNSSEAVKEKMKQLEQMSYDEKKAAAR